MPHIIAKQMIGGWESNLTTESKAQGNANFTMKAGLQIVKKNNMACHSTQAASMWLT